MRRSPASGSAPERSRTRIFCGNDQIARGVVDALRERGVKVPEDVSVVGFDNWEIVAAQTRPPLTTVDMELKELGRQAGLTVLALAEGRPVEPGVRKLPCRLVVRQSCGGNTPSGMSKGAKEMRHIGRSVMIKRLLAATSIATLCLVSGASAAEKVEMWVRTGIGDAFKKVVEAYNSSHDEQGRR